MSREGMGSLLAATLVFGGTSAMARAHHLPDAPGTLVGVSVALDGRAASLYPPRTARAASTSRPREGARYAGSQIGNRTHERLGVVLTVDGLNAISGDRERAPWGGSRPGPRMYVLDPWDAASVQGWRTSLDPTSVASRSWTSGLVCRALRQGQQPDGLDRGRGLPRAARAGRVPGVPVLRVQAAGLGRAAGRGRPQPGAGRAEPEASASRDTAQAQGKLRGESRRPSPLLPRHGLGRPRARPGRARQLRPTEPERARHAALRVPLGSRGARRAPRSRATARSPLAARTRRARLRAGPALVAVGSRATLSSRWPRPAAAESRATTPAVTPEVGVSGRHGNRPLTPQGDP